MKRKIYLGACVFANNRFSGSALNTLYLDEPDGTCTRRVVAGKETKKRPSFYPPFMTSP